MANSIGVGDCHIDRVHEGEWVIYGLGSCVGLILCDSDQGIWSMAHIFLPSGKGMSQRPCRYADQSIPYLLEKMEELGADLRLVYAQMAGGAKMFGNIGNNDIGARNIESVQNQLEKFKIPVVARQVGGYCGRTLKWDPGKRIAIVSRVGLSDEVLTPNAYINKEVEASGISYGRG
jgi:chemotaxis protein CheD